MCESVRRERKRAKKRERKRERVREEEKRKREEERGRERKQEHAMTLVLVLPVKEEDEVTLEVIKVIPSERRFRAHRGAERRWATVPQGHERNPPRRSRTKHPKGKIF